MRTVTYLVATTLDGFIAAPDGSFDFFPMSEEYARVLTEDYAETFPTHVREALGVSDPGSHFDTVVSGFSTYDIGPRSGYPSPYRHLEQYVVSSRADRAAAPRHPADLHRPGDCGAGAQGP